MSRHDHRTIEYDHTFICTHCGRTVTPPESGGLHRNHCPFCLWSRHVDLKTGDRRSGCRGAMEPIGIWVRPDREWAIIHRCTKCGFMRANRIAGDDHEPALFALAARPLTLLPFPPESALDSLGTGGAA